MTMLVLLTIHLSMNHAAVRAVSMRSLNRQRANILFSHLLAYDKVLTPQDVSRRERIFERDGVLRGLHDQVIGYGRIGVSFQQLLRALSRGSRATRPDTLHGNELARLVDLYKSELYMLWFDWEVSTVYILLKQGTTAQSQLKAWCQGLLLAQRATESSGEKESDTLQFAALVASLEQTSKRFDECTERLRAASWDLDIAALETRSGTRLECE
jgi:Vitamin B6 photo-protection and homoeostasis